MTNPKTPISGPSTEAPAACIIRAVINTQNSGAIVASNVPKVNSDIAVKNKARFVKRVIKKALAGTSTPLTSIKPVDNHCTSEGLTSNSVIIVGNATFSRVLLKKAMKAPMNKMAIIKYGGFLCEAKFSIVIPLILLKFHY